jgi:chloride channel protein, CIC family
LRVALVVGKSSVDNREIMDARSELMDTPTRTQIRLPWNEYRLLFYSALLGIAGGLGAQLFNWIVNFTQHLLLVGIAGYYPPEPGVLNPEPIVGPSGLWLIPVSTVLGGLMSGILVYTFAPEAEGHGTDAAVEAFHFKGGKIRPLVPLIKVLSSAITIGSGGAAGREGPTAQISVGLGSILSDLLRLHDEDRRILVLAGMAAGLAAVFRSPLGMAIFSVEILYSGMAFETEALIYTVIASVVAYAVNGLFVGWSPIFLLPQTIHFTDPIALSSYALLGIIAGVIGAIEPPIFYGIRDIFRSLKIPNHIKPAIGGLLMGLLALIFPEIVSSGYGWVQKSMTGGYIGWSLIFLALAKILAMSLTISSGGSGGVFGPNVYIGAMIGAWVAFAMDSLIPGAGLSPAAFAVVGMAAVFAGTARVPIATLIMVAEMTGGYGLIVPSMLSTMIAFVVERTVSAGFKYPRLYEAQVELRSDSPTHLEGMLKATFAVLESGPLVDLRNVTIPHLASLLRHGTPIKIHSGRGTLLAVNLSDKSNFSGRNIADVFDSFPELLAVAIIRDDGVHLPRGSTRIEGGDQLLIVASAMTSVESFKQLAGDTSIRPFE